MKAAVYDLKGDKKEDINIPELFSSRIREDIVAKYFQTDKMKTPYAPYNEAGRRHSAAGTIRHMRHAWKGHYRKGISRIPRKTMWRRGNQFFWIGAEISSTRGGRRAHPPKLNRKIKKINKKEINMALMSAFASTANEYHIAKRYSSFKKLNAKFPVIIELKSDNLKAGDVFFGLKKIFGGLDKIIFKNKELRAGKGKSRGRKYKKNAGLLLVKGEDEKIKIKGIDIKSVNEVGVADLYPLGRLTAYTKKSLEELEERFK